jgi:uncharacterized tellurite resistance protein B-like protein
MKDRIGLVTKLLMGAAYADQHLEGKEKDAIRKLLLGVLGDSSLPMDVEFVLDEFDPESLDVDEVCAAFAKDAPEVKRKLLELVAAVHEADDEYDFAEDDYLRQVAAALGVSEKQYADLVTSIEEISEDDVAKLRHGGK